MYVRTAKEFIICGQRSPTPGLRFWSARVVDWAFGAHGGCHKLPADAHIDATTSLKARVCAPWVCFPGRSVVRLLSRLNAVIAQFRGRPAYCWCPVRGIRQTRLVELKHNATVAADLLRFLPLLMLFMLLHSFVAESSTTSHHSLSTKPPSSGSMVR